MSQLMTLPKPRSRQKTPRSWTASTAVASAALEAKAEGETVRDSSQEWHVGGCWDSHEANSASPKAHVSRRAMVNVAGPAGGGGEAEDSARGPVVRARYSSLDVDTPEIRLARWPGAPRGDKPPWILGERREGQAVTIAILEE